jgi:phage terminase large subunit GpA-like protein
VVKKIKLSTRGNVHEHLDLDLTPYLCDPISLIGNYKIQWLGCIAPTQSGKTVFLQVFVADAIDQDPGPLLYVLPDEKAVRKSFDEKIISMINTSEPLAAHKTGRYNDISYSQVKLDHMTIAAAWAGSVPTMNSIPYKRAALDEVRLMPLTQGNESNAIKLTGDRLTTYYEYGIGQACMVSSPSIEGDLLHQQITVPGTLFVTWAVYCPHCNELQVLDFFTNLDFKRDNQCVCRYCDGIFSDIDKKKSWNKNGKYVKVNILDNKWTFDLREEIDYEAYSRVFFHWDSMVSPFRSFKRIAREFLETKDRLHDYKNFVQCWLAKFWIDDKSKINTLALGERKDETLSCGDVPKWVTIITAGIDTQDDGFYVVARGWGQNKKTCVVDAFFIPCNIETSVASDIKTIFERDIFSRMYRDSTIGHWKVAVAAIDTGGHRTKEIYAAASGFRRLMMIKGAHATQNVTIQYSKDYDLYMVRTMEYLDETDTRSCSPDFILPGNISKDYITQFCNIRRTIKQNKITGEQTTVWKKIGQNDYRMADVHSFICIDIPTDRGTFRAEMEKDDFIYNPYSEEKNVGRVSNIVANPQIEDTEYNITDINWGD